VIVAQFFGLGTQRSSPQASPRVTQDCFRSIE
jgi:hypothetical protein